MLGYQVGLVNALTACSAPQTDNVGAMDYLISQTNRLFYVTLLHLGYATLSMAELGFAARGGGEKIISRGVGSSNLLIY